MKDDRVFLGHIVDAATKIQRYVASGRDAFFADEMAQDAVVRNLEIIGEAAKHLSAGSSSVIPATRRRSPPGLTSATTPTPNSPAGRRGGGRQG